MFHVKGTQAVTISAILKFFMTKKYAIIYLFKHSCSCQLHVRSLPLNFLLNIKTSGSQLLR